MSEEKQVVESGAIEIGTGTGKTDPLNPTTLEEKTEHQDEPSPPQPVKMTEKALKALTEFFLQGVYVLNANVKDINFLMSTVNPLDVSDKIYKHLPRHLSLNSVKLSDVLSNQTENLSHFIEHGGITLYKSDDMSEQFSNKGYTKDVKIDKIDDLSSDLSRLMFEKLFGIQIAEDQKILRSVIHSIYSRDEQDKKELDAIFGEVDGWRPMSLRFSFGMICKYFSELRPILSLNKLACLTVQNAYLPIAQVSSQTISLLANATYDELGTRPSNWYYSSNNAQFEECSRAIREVLPFKKIIEHRKNTRSDVPLAALLSEYSAAIET